MDGAGVQRVKTTLLLPLWGLPSWVSRFCLGRVVPHLVFTATSKQISELPVLAQAPGLKRGHLAQAHLHGPSRYRGGEGVPTITSGLRGVSAWAPSPGQITVTSLRTGFHFTHTHLLGSCYVAAHAGPCGCQGE